LRKGGGTLTAEEARIIKGLLALGWRNQDIQALVNMGRAATINAARITEVKQSAEVRASPEAEVNFFIKKKRSYDPITGLNLFDHERLIRAREAMALGVQAFNSPTLKFKTEVFAVLANIAWTYLLHEYYEQKNRTHIGVDGYTPSLSQMLDREDCPLSKGMRQNLNALKIIRDNVEHRILGRGDLKWLPLFQACCLNFDKAIRQIFGDKLSLQHDFSVALQFARMDVEQIAALHEYEVPPDIEALDARLKSNLTDEELNDLEYQFRVIYTLDNASKDKAHLKFLHPDSEEAEEVRNILVKYKPSDHLYPHKPSLVVKLVQGRVKRRFTSHDHTVAWRKYKARPESRSKTPDATNREFCIYHPAHGDYTYSDKWIEFLVGKIEQNGSV
jgi:hypothetical protein